MIKIAAFSDTHFPKLVGIKELKALKISLYTINPDYVVIAGDLIEGGEKESFEIFLKEFMEIKCPKLVCLGNHDLWVQSFEEMTSLEKMEEFIELGEQLGYHMLDKKPFLGEDIGFAGTVGWYDYSFADPQFPIKDIENKILFYKGDTFAASWWNDRFYFRLKKRNPLMEMTFTEDDNFFIDSLKIPKSSREEDTYFTKLCYKHLNKSLDVIKDAKIKISVIHHLPFKELLNIGRKKTTESLFFNAYMGSQCFGELMMEKNVDVCICGHTHKNFRRKIHGIEIYNVSEIKKGIKKIEI
ncbi:MAG: metallophosphoesterase [Methanomicrobia archaeon]|nr:metallophosphoesterase [Methanomicrobia archaeon]